MPNMVVGTRGGTPAPGLRNVGEPKQPYFQIQSGVKLWDMKPQMAIAVDRVIAAFFKRGMPAIMTSAWRATSPTFSLHLFGYAVDFDTDRNLPPNLWDEIRDEIRVALGPEFQVLAHDVGSGMHIHVEWDPSTDNNWAIERGVLKERWSTSRRG